MIRNAAEADVPAILSIYAPYVLTSTATFEYDVPTEAEFMQRFREITRQFPWLVWEEDGKILGYAYASAPYSRAAYAWCAEPSVYLLPHARGRGIGKALYQVLEACLTLQGYHLLYALVTQENEDSLRFHKKSDYFLRAAFPDCAYKFGKSLGVNWLEKRLKTVENPSVFPHCMAADYARCSKVPRYFMYFVPFLIVKNMVCYEGRKLRPFRTCF